MIGTIEGIGPTLCVVVGALVLLLLEGNFRSVAFAQGGADGGESQQEKSVPGGCFGVYFSLIVLVIALVLNIKLGLRFVLGAPVEQRFYAGVLYFDLYSSFVSSLLLIGSLLAIGLGKDRFQKEGIDAPIEYSSVVLMALSGAMVLVSAAEFITFFLGLEILSMALYALTSSAIGEAGATPAVRGRSAEAGLKYFLLGSFSSAFLLYGMAILYGLTGSTKFAVIGTSLQHADPSLTLFAIALLLVGLIFKIGAVPFHFWVPDVYQGAPTPVTAFMACVVKAAAFAVALRVLWVCFAEFSFYWTKAIWLMSLLTIVFGNLIALRQRNVKRMLAFSSVAHAGYMMIGLIIPESSGGGSALLYYLMVYTLMTLGAFGSFMALSHGLNGEDCEDLSSLNGIGFVAPVPSAFLAFFMLALAGLPPALGGLIGKFYIFRAALEEGYLGLAIVGVLAAAVSMYYYLRVIVALYFLPPADEVTYTAEAPSPLFFSILLACGIGVIALGIWPAFLVEGAELAMGVFG